MLGLGARIVSSFRDLYNEINPATLTGAIDVVVVEQPDGSLVGTPFYVRFGKMGVLRSREKVVDVTINDEPIEDFFMKLDDTGEAYFVEDTVEEREIPIELATSPLPNASSGQLMTDGLAHLHNITGDKNKLKPTSRSVSPEPAVRQVSPVVKKFSDAPEMFRKFAAMDKMISVDDEIGVRKQKSQKRKLTKLVRRHNVELRRQRLRSSSWCSGNVEDLIIPSHSSNAEADDENVFEKKSKARKQLAKLKLVGQQSTSDCKTASHVDESARQMSGVWSTPSEDIPSPNFKDALVGHDEMFQLDFGEGERESLPGETFQPTEDVSKDETKLSDYASDWDNSSTIGSNQSSPTSTPDTQQKPKSVTFKSIDNNQKVEPVQSSSRWGISNMLGLGFMRRSNVTTKEGIYLDDLLNSNQTEIDPKLASMYLDNHHAQRKRNSTEDVNSDAKKSIGFQPIPQSTEDDGYCSKPSSFVYADHTERFSRKLSQIKRSEFLSNLSVSLCGNASGLQRIVTDEEFEKADLVYEDFIKNPDLLFSRRLVIKLNGKYYKYNVAVPVLISTLLFQMPLPSDVMERLCAKYQFDGDVRLETFSTPKIIQPTSPSASTVSSSSQAGVGSWFSWRRAASAEPTTAEKSSEMVTGRLTPAVYGLGANKSSKSGLLGVYGSSHSLLDERDALSDGELDQPATKSSRYRKTLVLTPEQWKKLNLRRDIANRITFSVTTKYQGTCTCECSIYLWKWDDKLVISDIDGTITISDVLGHIMPIIGRQWEHENVAGLLSAIADNGYKIVYLTARAIGQSQRTKDYLRSVKQCERYLPDGPLQLSPVSLFSAFHREVIEKTPEIFKMKCLHDLRSIFPVQVSPFYAGFGNRPNDEVAYKSSGIPTHRIFTINSSSSVCFLDKKLRSSYLHISSIMDQIFPPLFFKSVEQRRRKSVFSSPEQFSNFTYWRQELDEIEIDVEKFKDSKNTNPKMAKNVSKTRKNGNAGVH